MHQRYARVQGSRGHVLGDAVSLTLGWMGATAPGYTELWDGDAWLVRPISFTEPWSTEKTCGGCCSIGRAPVGLKGICGLQGHLWV